MRVETWTRIGDEHVQGAMRCGDDNLECECTVRVQDHDSILPIMVRLQQTKAIVFDMTSSVLLLGRMQDSTEVVGMFDGAPLSIYHCGSMDYVNKGCGMKED
jgi:hypothetical protein